jgi:hypothetical protein
MQGTFKEPSGNIWGIFWRVDLIRSVLRPKSSESNLKRKPHLSRSSRDEPYKSRLYEISFGRSPCTMGIPTAKAATYTNCSVLSWQQSDSHVFPTRTSGNPSCLNCHAIRVKLTNQLPPCPGELINKVSSYSTRLPCSPHNTHVE